MPIKKFIQMEVRSWDKSLSIGGPGEGANANLYFVNSSNQFTHLKLDINETGKGYSEEPPIHVLDENNQSLLILNPEWFSHGLGFNTNRHSWYTRGKVAS